MEVTGDINRRISPWRYTVSQSKPDKPAPNWLTPISESIRDSATVQQTAKAVGVTPKTVRMWIEDGHLATVIVGKRHMITEAALTRFLSDAAASQKLAKVFRGLKLRSGHFVFYVFKRAYKGCVMERVDNYANRLVHYYLYRFPLHGGYTRMFSNSVQV
jgi:excisionase family DNA binding protein